jgi:hypothetical protein
MLVPEAADCFWPTVGALTSFVGDKSVSFHTFSLPEKGCVRLLLKNVGTPMHKTEIRKELEA